MVHEEGGHSWTKGHVSVYVFMRGHETAILRVEAIKRNKIVTKSSGSKRKDPRNVDIMKALGNYI